MVLRELYYRALMKCITDTNCNKYGDVEERDDFCWGKVGGTQLVSSSSSNPLEYELWLPSPYKSHCNS